MQKNHMDLLALQARLKMGIESMFPDRVWVKAEISSISRRQNGHCYLELCQNESGTVAAKARAVIWASRWNYIDQYFRSVTGSSLDSGMEILARVQLGYHVVYGLTLTIDEVDPEFTLGANERQRQLTIERLTKEGLMNLQKQLRLPLLPYSLAVISAGNAAGYGDFCRHLLDNEYGFVFDVHLFEALMQGEGAPSSVISAFSEILSANRHFDAILIMRGGGSELDLACFDDYDLAVTIARCPVPVFTAIGHEKDHHVADMVASAYVKTPTALADLFLDCYIAEDQRLGSYESRLHMAFANRLARMSSNLDILESRIHLASRGRLQDAEHRMDLLSVGIFRKAGERITASSHLLDRLSDRVQHAAGKQVDRASQHLDRIESKVRLGATTALSEAYSFLMKVETRIETTDPRNILRKGFVLALDRDGVKIGSASGSKVGDRVQMMFADGTLKCGVVEIDRRSNIPGEEDGNGSPIISGLGS
ncbi:MAG: exodeoxyribonuclease VII large subunit [Bacteroidales bacterium]|nr:exodeoxyribonuclease VII large subunit [Bacteroidales bacterium]